MSETQKHNVEQKKPDRKTFTLYDPTQTPTSKIIVLEVEMGIIFGVERVGCEGGLMRMAVASFPDVGGSYTISLSQTGPLHSPFIK